MAAVGAEVTGSWFLSPGVVSFFILLVFLSIFLASLCSDCDRRSFELQDSSVERNPSSLIKVVKLEDAIMARENPIIDEIQRDEKEIRGDEEKRVQVTSCRGHLEAPQLNGEVKAEEESSVQFTPWRSHLTGANNQDHVYHTIGGEQAVTNQEPRSAAEDLSGGNVNSVYAQVSKKVKTMPTGTAHPPEQVQEEEESPPLPGRTTEMEG